LQRQLDTLASLDDTIQRAKLQLENSLTSLGTIYSQTMLVDAKDIDSGRARRLRQEIADEVTELHDVLIAMDEVYSAEGSA
jgi:outer membrane protein TolC